MLFRSGPRRDLQCDEAAKQEGTEMETGTGTKRWAAKDLYFHLSKFVSYSDVLSPVLYVRLS